MYGVKKISALLFVSLATLAMAQAPDSSAVGPGVHYATDAFPGFDPEKDAISPARKEPRWFQWLLGPKKDNPVDQYAYCRELEDAENWSKAVKEYDALVRNWPTSSEAALAQHHQAQILFEKLEDLDDALDEYKYLVDFYSFKCDYNESVDRLYTIAGRMRIEGKTILFFRFRNTVEVRHAYEASVLRAPGAKWTPDALLAIGELREEEKEDELAVAVYEHIRNIYYATPQAKTAVYREALARMRLLRAYGYNRDRCRDTVSFLKLARDIAASEVREEIDAFLVEAETQVAEEAYRSAMFYDSRMRTKRSAINAMENFLRAYPNSTHGEEVRARLEELKGQVGNK